MSTILQHNTPPPDLDAEDAVRPYSAADFARLAAQYPDLRMELTAEGEITLMAPAGFDSSGRNADLTADLIIWNRKARLGKVLDSSVGCIMPDGAILSPDASWVEQSRLNAFSPEQRTKFLPLCPDFVIELRSDSDRLRPLQKKMRDYIRYGVRLGFLVDPRLKRVEVHRPNTDVQVLDNPATVSADPELPGFTLDLTNILN